MMKLDRRKERSPDFSVVVPVFNEVDTVIDTIDRIHGTMRRAGIVPYELIVVNDGSSDGTGELLKGVKALVITSKSNRGYGSSLKTGIRAARGEIVVITDADGTYPVEKIPELLRRMSDNDMVVGARTGEHVSMPRLHRIPKWILQHLASYVVRYPIPDLNSGLRAIRRDVAMRYFHITPSGFSFTSTITMAMLAADYTVEFVPVDYYHRVGQSKISPILDTGGFFTMIIRTCLYFFPLRVFGPLSGVFLACAIIKFFLDIVYQPLGRFVISQAALLLSLVAVQIFILGLVADLIVRRTSGE